MKGVNSDIIDYILEASDNKELVGKALAAVNSLRYVLVSENPPIFIFMGEHGDYLVIDGIYCTCMSFQTSMMKGRPLCYHIIGSWIAMSLSKYHDLSRRIDHEKLNKIINEVLELGLSPTLRKELFRG